VATAGASEVSIALVAGFFLANVPQGISSASGMRHAGRSRRSVLGVCSSTLAAVLGAAAFADANDTLLAGLVALAAGGVLAMLAETMIPEAFHLNRRFIGLVTATGVAVTLFLS
jgi:ZIP family zinc transporter